MKIAVAYVRGPRGFKGELSATLYRQSSNSVRPGAEVTIIKGDRSRDLEVEYVKSLRKGIGLKLTEIDDQESAESWRGAEVLIELEKIEPLGEKEFYHFQLEGAEVFEEDGAKIGIVDWINDSAGNDLLIVRTENGEIIIPFVKAIIKSIDVATKKIIIRKIEGLY